MPDSRLHGQLLHDCHCELGRAACDLKFAAQDYAAAHSTGQGTEEAFESLVCVLDNLARVIQGWLPLVNLQEMHRSWWHWHPSNDDWENKLCRLLKHGVSYALWQHPRQPRYIPFEQYHRVTMARMKAFYAAARSLKV